MSRNLQPDAQDRTVVKLAKTINFLADYPNRRIQVVLKLLPSPTDILLNVDLDACALAYDGSQVLMLPRFVRALETGSSMFTMDLVWGHHLGDRRASQENRIVKYAHRNFGIRFLPSYARSLKDDFCLRVKAGSDDFISKQHNGKSNKDQTSAYKWEQRDRFPHGKEPGLKTLKRIAYLGRDFPLYFAFGVSPLILPPEDLQAQSEKDPNFELDQEILSGWKERVVQAQRDLEDWRARRVCVHTGPWLSLKELDGENLDVCLPPLSDYL